MKKLIDERPFEIEARVPIQLGRESISSSLVAISELIKNSYDADSSRVSVRFTNLADKNAAIIIIDLRTGETSRF